MARFLDNIFNPFSLCAINAGIIMLAEFSGGGIFFFESGAIHIIALLFIALAASRMFAHYYTFDPILEKFVHANLAALAIFAVSHIIEFLSMTLFDMYSDATFAVVANMYAASLLAIIIGSEMFLRVYDRRSTTVLWLSGSVIAALALLTTSMLAGSVSVSLEPDSALLLFYAALIFAAGAFALRRVWRIRKMVSMITGFTTFIAVAIVLVMCAASVSAFYEVLVDQLGMAEYQAVYLAHFIFYAALSVMFLAFGRLARLGGMHEDAQRASVAGKQP